MEKGERKSDLIRQEYEIMLLHPEMFHITEAEAKNLKSGAWSKREIRELVKKMREDLKLLDADRHEDEIKDLKKRIDVFDRAAYFLE